jgi:hypothetical protein
MKRDTKGLLVVLGVLAGAATIGTIVFWPKKQGSATEKLPPPPSQPLDRGIPQSTLNDIRRRAVETAYPDRDTQGWDIWAYDLQVGAIYEILLAAYKAKLG